MFKKVKQLFVRITNVGPTVSAIPNINQDMPPEGGFPSVRIRKGNPNRLWGAGVTTAFVGLISLYGWYKVYLYKTKKRELEYEQRLLEGVITPFLQAEKDITYTVQARAFQKSIEKLMKDKPEFNPKEQFYHNKNRYLQPSYSIELTKFIGTGVLESDKELEKNIKQERRYLE